MYFTLAFPLGRPTGTPSRHRVVERDRGRDGDTLQGEEYEEEEEEDEKRGEEEVDEKEEKRNLGLGILDHSLPLNLNTLPDPHATDCAVIYKGIIAHIHTQSAS